MANLIAARYGPASTVINAFFLIGFDLTARDRLHEEWSGDGLAWKMAAIIAAGGLVSWVINREAGTIAVASTIAFAAAAVIDTASYHLLRGRRRLVKVNGSNILSAMADSLIFPSLAFGAILPAVVLGQLAAKVGGGFVWSLLIGKR